jgi:predicted glycosyltransferase
MRIFLYSHDTYGLGHIRRTLTIAQQLAQAVPRASQLLVTGSMQSHRFDLPQQLDYIKLPGVSKRSNGEYCSRVLTLPCDTTMALRENIIFNAVQHFNPDVVLVDKAPAGVKGEMLRALRYLKVERPQTKLVLGMRDIEDDAAKVRTDWRRKDIYPLLEDVYDTILLYGSRAIYDPVSEYGLSPAVEAKMIPCGYVRRLEPIRPSHEVRRGLSMQTDRLVVITAGGGGDGFNLMDTYLHMLDGLRSRGPAPFDSLLITGPLMASAKRTRLRRFEAPGRALTVMEFTPDLFSYLGAADLIVSMGGYNSLCEILSLNQRAIVVPRVKPRTEQLLRVERFAAHGLLRMIHPNELTPARLFAEIATALDDRRPVAPEAVGIDMNGSVNASHVVARLLAGEKVSGRRTVWASERQHPRRDLSPNHKRPTLSPPLCVS